MSVLSPRDGSRPLGARSIDPTAEGVVLRSSPGVLAIELVELTRDMVILPFLEGVDGAGRRAELDISEARGRFTAIESEFDVSAEAIGRLRACGSCGDSVVLSWCSPSFLGDKFRYLRNAGRKRLGIRMVTTNLCFEVAFASLVSSVLSLAMPFRAVGWLRPSSFGLLSGAFGGVFLARCSSASISGGSVGDSRAGSRGGDLGFLVLEGGSSFFGLGCLGGSETSSRFFFMSLSFRDESPCSCFSKLRRNGDNKGGTNDLDASALVGVCRLPVEAGGRAPFTVSSRCRGAGEAFRLELDGPLRILRPLGKELELDGLPSRLEMVSRGGGRSLSRLLKSSSRRWDGGGSSVWRPGSGRERFGGRPSSLWSAKRFLFSGDGGRGGSELFGGGLGGSLMSTAGFAGRGGCDCACDCFPSCDWSASRLLGASDRLVSVEVEDRAPWFV
jgi:hypothetical protein